jgi:hypothetical protein
MNKRLYKLIRVAEVTAYSEESTGSWITPEGNDLSVPENLTHNDDALKNLGFKYGLRGALEAGYVRVMERSEDMPESGEPVMYFYFEMTQDVTKAALRAAVHQMKFAIDSGDFNIGVDYNGDYQSATNKMELGALMRHFAFASKI